MLTEVTKGKNGVTIPPSFDIFVVSERCTGESADFDLFAVLNKDYSAAEITFISTGPSGTISLEVDLHIG